MSHDLFFVFLRCAEEGLVIIISSVRGKHTFPRSHSCRMCCSAGQSKFELIRPLSAYSKFLRCHRNMTTQITSQGGYPLGSIAGQLKGNELVSLRVGPCSASATRTLCIKASGSPRNPNATAAGPLYSPFLPQSHLHRTFHYVECERFPSCHITPLTVLLQAPSTVSVQYLSDALRRLDVSYVPTCNSQTLTASIVIGN